MAGRKLEFDKEEALERAMELFWSSGYNATGLNDLLKAMGIQRQSLYNTFGSKHQLFLEAVQHYGDTVVSRIEAYLGESGSPLGNIRNFLRMMAEKAASPGYRGCLVTNSLMELTHHDSTVADVVKCLSLRVEKALQCALERAVEQGELPNDTNVKQLARFLHHIILGFNVCGKARPSQSYIDDILQVAFSVLE